MAHVITFRTARFDPAAEPANPINPIAGHAVLLWLADPLRNAGFACGEPAAEDWGWYLDPTGHGATYLLGASGEGEPGGKVPIDWTIQIHRHRSLSDKLFGRNVHAVDDALTTLAADGLGCGSGWASTPSSSASGAWAPTRIPVRRPQQQLAFGRAEHT